MKNVILSIIIVHYKTRELTLQCLRSIRAFSPAASYEILLIDSDSKDGIGETVAEEFPQVRFIEVGRNDGFGRANNLGIVNAHGKYLLLLNSDTQIIEPIFDSLVEYMEVHPEVGCLGPQHFDGAGKHQVSYGKFPNLFTEILRKIVDFRIALNDSNIRGYLEEYCSTEQDVDWLSGSCLLLRREAMRQVGLLDESFFMYFEDVDLCKRIYDVGWKVVFYPLLRILHYSGQSVKENILAGLVAYRQSQLYFARKHYGRWGDCLVRAMLFLKFGAVGLVSLFKFLIRKAERKDTVAAYVEMLLSRKVFRIIFSRNRMRPVEPVLN